MYPCKPMGQFMAKIVSPVKEIPIHRDINYLGNSNT